MWRHTIIFFTWTYRSTWTCYFDRFNRTDRTYWTHGTDRTYWTHGTDRTDRT
jgi:hypothetical protein